MCCTVLLENRKLMGDNNNYILELKVFWFKWFDFILIKELVYTGGVTITGAQNDFSNYQCY